MPITTCRYLGKFRDQCTAEAADPDAEILLCPRHLAAAWRLITERTSNDDEQPTAQRPAA